MHHVSEGRKEVTNHWSSLVMVGHPKQSQINVGEARRTTDEVIYRARMINMSTESEDTDEVMYISSTRDNVLGILHILTTQPDATTHDRHFDGNKGHDQTHIRL